MKDFTMTRFVHVNFPAEHPGVVRAEAIAASVGNIRRNFDGTKGLATMLLAALVAALVVVADQMIDTWADGHLFAAWVALWSVAFVALALFGASARDAAAKVAAGYQAWTLRLQQSRDEALYWESAQRDPRIMAELDAAILRNEQAQETLVKPVARDVYSPMASFEARRIKGSYLRSF
jgi:hypothetical protein